MSCISTVSCVTIHDIQGCAAQGLVANGGICSHTQSDDTQLLSMRELLDLIEAQPNDRFCVPKKDLPVCSDDQSAGVKVMLPARGASIILSSGTWITMKGDLEQACRELGSRCSLELKNTIKKMDGAQ